MTGELAAEHPSEPRASEEQPATGPRVVLGLLLAGRWANEVAAGLGKALTDQLMTQHPSARWSLKGQGPRPVPTPAAAREALAPTRLPALPEGPSPPRRAPHLSRAPGSSAGWARGRAAPAR